MNAKTSRPPYGSTYEPSRSGKAFFVLLGIAIAGPCVFLIMSDVVEGRYDHPGVWAVFLLPVFWGLYLALNEFRKKVVFLDYEVEIHSLRGIKRVPFDNIRGCRIIKDPRRGKSIVLVTDKPELKEVPLPSRLNEDISFSNWIAQLPDMDKVDLAASEASIISDNNDWLSPEERKKKLSAARMKAIALNIAGVVVFAWGCLSDDQTLLLAACLLAAFPLIALALAATAKNHYSLWFSRNDARGPLGFAVVLPGLGLWARILAEFQILDWKESHTFAVGIALLMTLYVNALDKSVRKVLPNIFLPLLLIPYGYSSIELVNIAADISPLKTYGAPVLDKYKTSGSHGSHTYSLTIGPWKEVPKKETFTVLWPLYNSVSKGDTVCILYHDGYLGIPWFKIENCTGDETP